MAINFPNSPANGTSYTYQGITHTFLKPTAAVGHWAILTPGTVGVASGAEIDAGTDTVKYVTPAGIKASKIVEEDIDGVTRLDYNGTQRLETTNAGVLVTGSDIAVTRPDGNPANLFANNTEGGLRISTDVGAITMATTNSSGTADISVLTATRAGSTDLYHNNVKKFETTSSGVEVSGTALVLDNDGTGAAALFIRNDEGGARLTSNDDNFSVFQTDGIGNIEDLWINMTNNAGVSLYHNNVEKLETTAGGVEVFGTEVVLDSNNTSGANLHVRNSEGGVRLGADGGAASLVQTDNAGTFQDYWMFCQQDAGVSLYYNGSSRLATTNAGLTVSGQVTTAGLPTSPNHLTTKNYVDGVNFMTAGSYSGGTQFILPAGTTWDDYRKIEIFCGTGGVNDITSASATFDVFNAVGLTQFRILAYSSQQSDVAYIQSISTNSFSCHGVDGDYVRLVRGYRK